MTDIYGNLNGGTGKTHLFSGLVPPLPAYHGIPYYTNRAVPEGQIVIFDDDESREVGRIVNIEIDVENKVSRRPPLVEADYAGIEERILAQVADKHSALYEAKLTEILTGRRTVEGTLTCTFKDAALFFSYADQQLIDASRWHLLVSDLFYQDAPSKVLRFWHKDRRQLKKHIRVAQARIDRRAAGQKVF